MRSNKLIKVVFLSFALSGLSVFAQKPYKAYLVSNAHFDTQWNWDVQTSINQFVRRTMDRNFLLFEKYPDYVFNFEGGIKYKWMKEYYPDKFKKVKEYVRQGRWHVSGSSWDANDANMPSPESFFRNILLGQEFYKKEFGVQSKDIFLPDCFGFGYTIPTIASHCGLIGFSTQKLQWRHNSFYGNSKFPFNIGLWKGLDGSEIMASLNSQNYVHTFEGEDISNDNEIRDLANGSANKTAYKYYGTGDQGGSPTLKSVMSVEKGLKGSGNIEIINATSDQLFKDYLPFKNHPELPVFDGELLMDIHGTGCYTSQAAMKRFNRRNEQLAVASEKAAVVANCLVGSVYPSDEIDESWKRFIWHQFHDDLTGTSIPKAYTFSWNDELISQSCFADVITSSVGRVAKELNTNTTGTPLVIYNPLSTTHKGLVKAEIALPGLHQAIHVFDPKGKEVNAQLIGKKNGKAEIVFCAEVAPIGYAVYDVRTSKSEKAGQLKVTANTLENRIYKIVLNSNGDIASLMDKRNNKELVKKGQAFRLALFTKNESYEWPAWEIDKKTIDVTPIPITDSVSISIAEKGPACASLCVKRRYGNSRFTQYIRLTDGATDDRVDIVNEIDWRSTNTLLKAEFPMSVSNPKATYDLGLGFIKRGNNTTTSYETYAQQWADITGDEGYGISVMNDCKYGWDKPSDNTLRLTLLHTPKTDGRYSYQDHQDFGHHTFTYSIVGHENQPQFASIPSKSEELNNPLIAFETPRHKGSLGSEFSFVKLSTPQIELKALKKAENGDKYILRFYETQGKEAKDVTVEFPTEIVSAAETNGVEDEIGKATFKGNKLTFSTTAFSPKTFAVQLKENIVTSQPIHNTPVELPYTDNAFTYDAFNEAGEFDKDGCSYAAELISRELVSQGIPFKIADMETNNVLKCKNNLIGIPKDRKYTKVYLLAASTVGDIKADFTFGNKVFKCDIPYYSGFYGQWGQTDFTKSFVKDVPLAYVGSHRHSSKYGNEAYTFTYMYRICLDIPQGATQLQLPDDNRVAMFAITFSDNYADDVKAASSLTSTLQ
ncbi:MAG: glycoside hydrolase family 38 C-terminal domain-containing protein [Bacteroidota bacterium]|nr:glycoside hydrolase family 38 C-terminal domain-containing protein [Bacteroidota bacterium]